MTISREAYLGFSRVKSIPIYYNNIIYSCSCICHWHSLILFKYSRRWILDHMWAIEDCFKILTMNSQKSCFPPVFETHIRHFVNVRTDFRFIASYCWAKMIDSTVDEMGNFTGVEQNVGHWSRFQYYLFLLWYIFAKVM